VKTRCFGRHFDDYEKINTLKPQMCKMQTREYMETMHQNFGLLFYIIENQIETSLLIESEFYDYLNRVT